MERNFDFDDVFGDDYLYFMGSFHDEVVNAQNAEQLERLLAVPSGSRVLDIGCGYGRMSIPLAQRGYKMVGIDRSALFLGCARETAAGLGVPLELCKMDMRELTFESEFDAAFIWFSTFGYFGDDENRAVLRGAAKALKPGGILVMESVCATRMIREFQPSHVGRIGDDFLLDESEFDLMSSVVHTRRTTFRDGQLKTARFSVRVFMPNEIVRWFEEAGFGEVRCLDRSGEPFALNSRRLVVVGKKVGVGL